ARQVQGAQTAREPAVNQLAFLLTQIDARELLDQRPQGVEVFIFEGELADAAAKKGLGDSGDRHELLYPKVRIQFRDLGCVFRTARCCLRPHGAGSMPWRDHANLRAAASGAGPPDTRARASAAASTGRGTAGSRYRER